MRFLRDFYKSESVSMIIDGNCIENYIFPKLMACIICRLNGIEGTLKTYL